MWPRKTKKNQSFHSKAIGGSLQKTFCLKGSHTILSDTLTAEPVTIIPNWIKIHAGWWAGGQINDSAYLQGIQYLIKEGIMVIPSTERSESSGSQEVPGWVKNSAKWWATNQIDDIAYISGIQYLVSVGIIVVS